MSRQKCPKAIQGCALKTRRTGTPARNGSAVPERRLNGAYKVSQMHLPPPNLPRFGGGVRPPFLCKPPAPLTITMGQRLIFRPIIVPRPNHRDPPPPQALTYPEDQNAALHLPAHPGPFPALGKGGGGKGQMRCGYLGSDSVRSTDLFFPIIEGKRNPYPAQPATGVLGQRPKRILPTFVRTKVGPRRAGVLIKSFIRLAPPEVITNSPPPSGIQIITL